MKWELSSDRNECRLALHERFNGLPSCAKLTRSGHRFTPLDIPTLPPYTQLTELSYQVAYLT